jgi:acyl-CoA thioesterase FadM
MYPYIRVYMAAARARRQGPLAPGEVHTVTTRCWPWDIDPFMELNNGRSLTLMDIGRISMFGRLGLRELLRERGMRLTMAGSRVQYRRRVMPFAKMEIRSRLMGRDARFLYVEHVTWTKGAPAHHALYRVVIVGDRGIVPTEEALRGLDHPGWHAELPDYIAGWAAAEYAIPWPPEI